MKPLFPLLLTYVMMTTQTFALSGGPVFGNKDVTVPGVYSGVLQGVTETTGTTGGPAIPGDPISPPDATTGTPSNAIGLFDLSVPETNLATGTFIMFADGTVFTGTIDASGDPDSGEIKGVLQGTYNFTLNTTDATGAVTSTQLTATALGQIDAQVRNATQFTNTLARLTGSANLEINFGQVDTQTLQPIIGRTITFDVVGFKQSVL